MTPQEQVHFQILRAIERNPKISQRELARKLGVSNGKAHYLLRMLVEKGMLKIGHFAQTNGKLGKVTYLLTAEGISSRAALTRGYLARKEVEYEALWAEIKALRNEDIEIRGDLRMLTRGKSN